MTPFFFILNYTISEWTFIKCGKEVSSYIVFFLLIQVILSVSIYVVVTLLSKRYFSRLVDSLFQLNSLELSYLMSKCKEKQYLQNRVTSSCNNCLVCYEYEAQTITYPCHHAVMCGRCAWMYIGNCLKNHQTLRCIVCRADINDFKGDIQIHFDQQTVKIVSSHILESKSNASSLCYNQSCN